MYTVTFNFLVFRKTDSVEEAIGIALNLHKASNIEHSVSVCCDKDTILTLQTQNS